QPARQKTSAKQGSGRLGAILGALGVLVVAGGAGGYWYWQSRNSHADQTGTAQQTANGTQQNNSGSAPESGTPQTASNSGQATQQSTVSGAGATAAQQDAATGTPSTSGGATIGGDVASSTAAPTTANESTPPTQSGMAAATTGNAAAQQPQQTNVSTVATPPETVQTAPETSAAPRILDGGSHRGDGAADDQAADTRRRVPRHGNGRRRWRCVRHRRIPHGNTDCSAAARTGCRKAARRCRTRRAGVVLRRCARRR